MSFETKIESDILHIQIAGRFDFSLHQEFRGALNQFNSDIKKIEVDLSKTNYLDSSALGMLLILRDKVAGSKDAVVIKGAAAEVKKVLQIANFDKLFTFI
ncbi:MAG: STAS domain-containing protein [Methylomonas sp.]|jgi:anti-anti-sigma regulatory factor|uniref:STAS domain-containing protein n=1 Tax=Methylomonas sp. TaxID=418 RepID=UPI0025EF4FC4|nr:STAS domain-containing protein [Methylomonas sp.]MCK9604935.1 STAS domain-containing protein [Methylomonas sp.]